MAADVTRQERFRLALAVAGVLAAAFVLAPLDLVASRGRMFQGIIGSYDGHTHAWTADPAMGEPIVTVSEESPLPEEIITISGGTAMDMDTCTTSECPLAGTTTNQVERISWSDADEGGVSAGGEFGYDDNGSFVPSSDPDLINRYKCPPAAKELDLTLEIDDIPQDANQNDAPKKGKKKITVWKVLNPTLPGAGQPRDIAIFGASGGAKYLLDASGGKLQLEATAEVSWSVGLNDGSAATIVDAAGAPLVAPARIAYVKYNQLPNSNMGFGLKMVMAMRGGRMVGRQIRLFYGPLATTHPPIGGYTQAYSDTVPNWFYYMLRIPSVGGMANFLYDAGLVGNQTGMTRWEQRPANDAMWPNLNGWTSFLGPNAYSAVPVLTDWNAILIDNVAWTCRHELFHHQHMTADWPNINRVPADDADPNNSEVLAPGGLGDWLKDMAEANRNVPAVGGAMGHLAGTFDPLNGRTYMNHWGYGGPWNDAEEYTLHNQAQWVNGGADQDDWSVGGWQFRMGI